MKIFVAAMAAALHAQVPELVEKRCVACHQGKAAPAGLNFRELKFDLGDAHAKNWWVRVYDAVEKGQMPPAGAPSLKPVERADLLKFVAGSIVTHERQSAALQGRSVLRRLNRYEYENTVRDVLGAPWLPLRDSLPEDGIVQRFNKSGQALDISHVQMARYLETAEHALRLALESSRQPSAIKRLYARDQQSYIFRMKFRPGNNHPERAPFPAVGWTAQPEIIADKAPLSDPATRDTEVFVNAASHYIGNEAYFNGYSAPAGGRYKLRVSAYTVTAATKWDKNWNAWRPSRDAISKGRTVEPVTLYALSAGSGKRFLGSFDVTPEPSVREIETFLLPGEELVPDAARLFRSRPGFRGNPDATEDGTPGLAYRWIEVEGPIQAPATRDNFQTWFQGKSAADAERLMRAFAARAYRRTAREDEIQRYLGIVKAQLRAARPFEEAMIAGYSALLCSPGFLYLEEKPGPLDSTALASRLSYLLWNSAPDAALRKVAAADGLRTTAALRAQALRLLRHERSADFVHAFLDYWLDLRGIGDTTPDQVLYPEAYLDDLLTESSLFETQMFFKKILDDDLPVRNLIDSRFTIANEHLARHYQLPRVEGVAMRPVTLPQGSVRGGLLTQASILKITANGTTTSPVLRGVWMAERILGDPPPPPPPSVPAVEPDTRGSTTIREQLDKHRSIPSCAGCHRKIDPPGFALESFDVVGAYRERYRSTQDGDAVKGYGKNGHPFAFKLAQNVDASGTLVNGESFADVKGLKRALLKDERQIARNMVKQFVTYATGAPVSFADRAEVERILDRAEPGGYPVRTLLLGVIENKLFRNK